MMNIKKIQFVICLLFAAFVIPAYSQQGAILKPMDLDSTQFIFDNQDISSPMITGSLNPEPMKITSGFPAKIPNFNYQQNNSIKFDFDLFSGFPTRNFSIGSMGLSPSPFFNNASILSQDAYAISDRIIVGGYSYGANSIFSSPFPNQNIKQFDTYGNTLFMQYKVSKNIKIETRFNVTTGHQNGF